ncbi:hypothetical protein [Sphingomonas sp. ABOLD]|uniref:oxidoreductase n=1 Tax=Sphingomonas sp. ABOLD TaxID=1985877 RepID=UPI001F49EFB1|nr:hypothetical protein [Sphingomonas sp. ABOLD]
MHPTLFSPVTLGRIDLPNRIVMAPLTRSPAGAGNVPTDMIITEATQIAGWRKVADAVHAEGGRIVMQLWHVGRVSHPVFQPGGAAPVELTAMDVPGKTFIIDADGNGAWAEHSAPEGARSGRHKRDRRRLCSPSAAWSRSGLRVP